MHYACCFIVDAERYLLYMSQDFTFDEQENFTSVSLFDSFYVI